MGRFGLITKFLDLLAYTRYLEVKQSHKNFLEI